MKRRFLMALEIYSNEASLHAQKELSKSQSALQTSFNRLSSGARINSAKDDAAGLGVSEQLKVTVKHAEQGNGNDAESSAPSRPTGIDMRG
jgi:flagellin